METINELPIFCDNCPSLALAVLDDAPLCESCLLQAVGDSNDQRIVDHIAPLRFKEPQCVPGLSKHCDSDYAA